MMKRLLFLFTGITLLIYGCTKEFSNPPSPGRMIKQFKLETGQYGDEAVSVENGNYTIDILVAKGSDLTAITPQIKISDDATITPKSGDKINISTNTNITYTVTAADGQSRNWLVRFKVVDSVIGEYGAYTFVSSANNKFLGVAGDTLYNNKYNNNAKLQLSGVSVKGAGKWQKWHIIYKSTDNGVKYYQIRNLFSGKLLNVPNSSTTPNLQLEQNQIIASKADDQLWKIIESDKPGVFQIVNKGNGMALTSENTVSSDGINKAVQQSLDPTYLTQKWKLTPIMAESYRDDDVVNFFRRTTGSVAFDQGTSVPLADGRVIWITQDAFYQGSLSAANGRLFGNHFISYGNSLIMQPTVSDWSPSAPMVTAVGAKYNIGNVFPVQPGLTWSWPGVGVEIGNKVFIQCGEGNGLTAVNQSLYELTPNGGTQWTFKRTTPTGMSNQVTIGYSSGMVKAADGYVYSYGSSSPPGSFGYTSFLHVARFPVTDPQSWTFWNGSAWVNTPTANASSKIDDGLATNSVSYVNGKYIHLSMDQGYNCGDNSRNIYISTSSSPTGPFTNRKLVHHITEYLKGYNARYYTPAIHSESVNGRDELLITYSLNFGACPQNSDNNSKESDGNYDPYYYQVKGIRIPYAVIGL